MGRRYLVIAGPTGSGKTALAIACARRLNGEVVSCDSVQVYRGLDVGSAKATAEERAAAPHHLLDVADPREDYDAARYAREARSAIDGIHARGKVAIVCGGTGLYLRALLGKGWNAELPGDARLKAELAKEPTPALYERLQRLDPVRAGEVHPNDRFRVVRSLELVTLLGKPLREAGMTAGEGRDPDAFLVVLEPERPELHRRIEARTRAMLAGGLLKEVKGLLAAGVAREAKPMQSIGYKHAAAFLAGELAESELEAKIAAATRQYAKRQCTWFRGVDADLRLSAPDLEKVLAGMAELLHDRN